MDNSKSVTSNQQGIHQRLTETVNRHIQSAYKKPYQQHNIEAFGQLQQKLNSPPKAAQYPQGLIFDSCCGTGLSSITLAEQNPNALIVGVDQSFARLNKNTPEQIIPDNCLLLQANCEDIWRMCIEHKIHFEKHYILYPNPWPKSSHLKRRWHGHPVFPVLKDLAKQTIVRSNWPLYLEEFAQSWCLLTDNQHRVKQLIIEKPLTLFEKKYWLSGQTLFELVVE
jgi:tRNA (guanine-N7-)-methyltransferase